MLKVKSNSLPYIMFPSAQNRPLSPRVIPSQKRIIQHRSYIKDETAGENVLNENTTVVFGVCFIVYKPPQQVYLVLFSNVWRSSKCLECAIALWLLLLAPASLHSFGLHTDEAPLLQAPSRVSIQLYLPYP